MASKASRNIIGCTPKKYSVDDSVPPSLSASKHRPSLGGIKSTLQRVMPKIRERYKVKSLGVFGSYVRGEAGQTSDLDLLVEFDQAPTLYQLIRMEQYLSEQVRYQGRSGHEEDSEAVYWKAHPGGSGSRLKDKRDYRDCLQDI